MYMSHRWGISYNSIGNKEIFRRLYIGCLYRACHSITSLDTAAPCAMHDLPHFFPPLTNISIFNTLKTRQQTWVFHHVGHERLRIAADTEEFNTVSFNKVLENRMCADPHSMVERWPRQHLGDWDDSLNISARANNMNGNVEAWA